MARAAGRVAVIGVLVGACNALTGVNDLRFGEEAPVGGGGDAGQSGGASATGGKSGTGGAGGASSGGSSGAGGGGAGGSGGTGGAGGTGGGDGLTCGLSYTDTACAACVATECCDLATTCSGNAECVAYRTCRRACTDGACLDACVRRHQCGLTDWYDYLDCTNTRCATECSGAAATDAGAGTPDAGAIDGGPACSMTPCDPVARCGCAPGQACTVRDRVTGTTVCGAPGSLPPGSACVRDADCAAGSGCIDGACKAYCNRSADCPGNARCYWITHAAPGCDSAPTPGAGYCTVDCDPVDPAAACGAGTTCRTFRLDDQGTYGTDCEPAGDGRGLAACTATDSSTCAPGTLCVTYTWGTTTSSACSRWCCMPYASDCGVGERCVPLATAVTLGGVEYGYCATRCDPLDPAAACGDGSCEPFTFHDGADVATDCFVRTGDGVGSGGCDEASQHGCAQGYACISYGDPPAYSCEPWCVATNPSCFSGTTCDGRTDISANGVTYSTCH